MCPCRAEAGKLRKGEDTMDVWFDSGSSWAGVLGRDGDLNYPADLYLEVGVCRCWLAGFARVAPPAWWTMPAYQPRVVVSPVACILILTLLPAAALPPTGL